MEIIPAGFQAFPQTLVFNNKLFFIIHLKLKHNGKKGKKHKRPNAYYNHPIFPHAIGKLG